MVALLVDLIRGQYIFVTPDQIEDRRLVFFLPA